MVGSHVVDTNKNAAAKEKPVRPDFLVTFSSLLAHTRYVVRAAAD